MARRNSRIIIPQNPEDCLALAARVVAKNEEAGANSPLKPLNVAGMKTLADDATARNEAAKQLAREAALATSQRDDKLGVGVSTPNTVRFILTQVRDLLLALNKDDPRKLGEWGFDVVESTPPTKPPTPPVVR